MEAEDLRRGNLILTAKDKGGKKFLRSIVQEIKKDSVVVDGDRVVLITDCEGISITEEWLKQFGFQWETDKRKSHLGIRIIDEDSWLHFYFNESGSMELTQLSNHSFLSQFDFPALKHIHQLQNLYYALTGEELKILTPVS